MKTKIKKNLRKKERGLSLIEVIPLVMVIASLFGFLLGFWGMIHRHTLNSIAARNYAFETFGHRANLVYFNDKRSSADSYEETELRFHSIGDSTRSSNLQAASVPFRFPAAERANEPDSLHRQRIWTAFNEHQDVQDPGNLSTQNPWIQVAYGICINANCGD